MDDRDEGITTSDDAAGTPCLQCRALMPDWLQVCDNCGNRLRSREAAARAELSHVLYLRKQIPWLQQRGLLPDDALRKLAGVYETRQSLLEQMVAPTEATELPAPPEPASPERGRPPLTWRDQLDEVEQTAPAPPARVPAPFDFDLTEAEQPHSPPIRREPPPIPVVPVAPEFPPAQSVSGEQSDTPLGAEPQLPLPFPPIRTIDAESASDAERSQPKHDTDTAERQASAGPPPKAQPRPARSRIIRGGQGAPIEFGQFVQNHGLKLVFLLASLLLIFALRNIIAWQAVSVIAVRLLPLIVIGLTVMFALFGRYTRQENPWAAFTFHGMACLLSAFDVGAVNRFWLEPIGAGLVLKPALLLASLTGTAFAAVLLRFNRDRASSYIHLFEAGLLTACYCGLQEGRLLMYNQRDFRSEPIVLFAGVYLLLSGINLIAARRARAAASPPAPAGSGRTADIPPRPDVVLILWANLSVTAIALLCGSNVLLQQAMHAYDFALMLLFGGLLYTIGAQMLNSVSAARAAGVLYGGSALLWVASSFATVWHWTGSLLMGISALALALAYYNGRTADAAAARLSHAWRRIALIGIFCAAATVGLQSVTNWSQPNGPLLTTGLIDAAQALLSGLFLVLFYRDDRRDAYLYGAFAAWTLAIISTLQSVRSVVGAYAVVLTLYGALLWAIGAALRRSRPAVQASDGAEEASAGAAHRPLMVSGQIIAFIGVLSAGMLPLVATVGGWAWTTATMAMGCALYAFSANEHRSRRSVYTCLACLAYASATAMWRIDPSLSLADRLSPFACGTAITAFVVAYFGVRPSSASPGDTALPAPMAPLWRGPLAHSALAAILLCIFAVLPAALFSAPMAHPVWTLAPAVAASLLLFAARRYGASDPLRQASAIALTVATALLLVFQNRGPVWNTDAVRAVAISWVAQGWLFWLAGLMLSRSAATRLWAIGPIGNGLLINTLAAFLLNAAVATRVRPDLLWAETAVAALGVIHWIAEGLRSGAPAPRVMVLIVLLVSLVGFHSLNQISAYPGLALWTALSLLTVAGYGLMAEQDAGSLSAALIPAPLCLGFASFAFWRQVAPGANAAALHRQDVSMANIAWIGTMLFAAWLFHRNALRPVQRPIFALAASVAAIAAVCHTVDFTLHTSLEWLLALSLLGGLAVYALGVRKERTEPAVSAMYRNAALGYAALEACVITGRAVVEFGHLTPGSLLPAGLVMIGVFALAIAETWRTGKTVPCALSLVVIIMNAVAFEGRLTHLALFPGTLWTLFCLIAAVCYFLIAARLLRAEFTYCALLPILLGSGLYEYWKAQGRLPDRLDIAIANGIVLIGGLATATGYLRTAFASRGPNYTYLAAALYTATWCFVIHLLVHPAPEWFALAVLPLLLAFYAAGHLTGSRAEWLGHPLRRFGFAAALSASALLTVRAGLRIGRIDEISLLPIAGVTSAGFTLSAVETYRYGTPGKLLLSLAAYLALIIGFSVHIQSHLVWPATLFTVLSAGAASAYFFIAHKHAWHRAGLAALVPIGIGFARFVYWRQSAAALPMDLRAADILWTFSLAGTGAGYIDVARQSQRQSYAYLSGALLLAMYTHAIAVFAPSAPIHEHYALIVLPLLIGMYAFGIVREPLEPHVGTPYRRVALIASVLAILWSARYGDFTTHPAHLLITWTLTAYGAAYAVIALTRRTQVTFSVASVTLTLAYLHGLLCVSPLWGSASGPVYPWPQISLMAIGAGYVWLASGWLLGSRGERADLARPLLALSGCLALLSGALAFATHGPGAPSTWSVMTLFCAATIWLGLWHRTTQPVWWHAAAWNLLAGWYLSVIDLMGYHDSLLDLYLIPFGIYILLTGHRIGSSEPMWRSKYLWGAGLLVCMAPALMRYWDAPRPGYHVALLVAECVLATLWGIFRRIRVYAGLGFVVLVLLTVSSWFRYVHNDFAGPISALIAAIALFVAGFYALTRRARLEAWLARIGSWTQGQTWR